MNRSERLLGLLEEDGRRRRIFEEEPRVYVKDRSNPIEDLTDTKFYKSFHMTKTTATYLFNILKDDLQQSFSRSFHIAPLLQLLVAIRFYVTGSFQIAVGDIYIVSQPTVSRIVKKVSTALARKCKQFVKFPTLAEAAVVRRKFYEIKSFPGVVGCIDGTHIEIQSPGGNDAELFRNRKGVFSINVQGICDADMCFTDVVARWYGSAHDSRIFDNSWIKTKLEDKLVPGLILGDSGYACTPYLMTPLLKPNSPAERRYNCAQKTTRNIIERCFGIWKRRFPCLNFLRTKLDTTLTIIVALAVLHNICRRQSDTFEEEERVEPEPETTHRETPATTTGRSARANLINSHFR